MIKLGSRVNNDPRVIILSNHDKKDGLNRCGGQ